MFGPSKMVVAQIEAAVQAFDQGNEFYRLGQYSEAVETYHQAIDGGFTSGALLYNLGNAYFRLDELGQAIRYYEKARLLLPENLEHLSRCQMVLTIRIFTAWVITTEHTHNA